ncbi:MAG: hydrogenase small subunit [Nitrospinae bacterium]|nr:hydrogenase small subunit [Nitrospinota bacterium]
MSSSPSDSPSDKKLKLLSEINRRDFMSLCTQVAVALGMANTMVPKIAEAIEKAARRPSVVWLHFQECTGDAEAFLRSTSPSVAELVLDILSIDYHETIMAASGEQAEQILQKTIKENKGKYLVVCEGAIPMGTPPGPGGKKGAYLTIGNRTGLELAEEVCSGAMAVISLGNCASYGGVQAQKPNPTGAMGVGKALGIKTVNIPGCPHNPVNSVATIVNFLLLGTLPATDRYGRPLFAFEKRIHDQCTRRAHFDAGQFVTEFGSEEAKKGFCLYKMGCKGPQTYHNCNIIRYNDHTGWPIGAGHGCVGCSEPNFWDSMSPFYARLEGVEVPFGGVESTADKIGMALTGAAAAGAAVHAAYTFGKKKAHKENIIDTESGEDK